MHNVDNKNKICVIGTSSYNISLDLSHRFRKDESLHTNTLDFIDQCAMIIV